MKVTVKKNGAVLAHSEIERVSKFHTSKEDKFSTGKVMTAKVIKNGEVISTASSEDYKRVGNNFNNKSKYNNNRNNNNVRNNNSDNNQSSQQKARDVEKEKNDIKQAARNINSQNRKGKSTDRTVKFNNRFNKSTEIDVTNKPVEEVLEDVKHMVEDTVCIKASTDEKGKESIILKGVSDDVNYEDMEIEGEYELREKSSDEHIKNNF